VFLAICQSFCKIAAQIELLIRRNVHLFGPKNVAFDGVTIPIQGERWRKCGISCLLYHYKGKGGDAMQPSPNYFGQLLFVAVQTMIFMLLRAKIVLYPSAIVARCWQCLSLQSYPVLHRSSYVM